MITNAPLRTGFGLYLSKKGITSKVLAERLGYSLQAVKSWRSGAREPQRGAVVLIAQTLGLTEKRLLQLLRHKL